ncbi:hypothetical protein QQS21_009032 [Conoideocrella luteorostrata]|uniref:DNA repair metallo-beta-lactamase domain-containing protein n=1 Tax=Conoideocrella luteorostrata TaxID=1105319 RepID=A0AAJ0CIK8_9HYPO|nr:hypothetical protein QQS21_009032 [Conoideocrella luteorostrata]
MFLIEDEGKAVLYTGDVRAEPWFVNSIARNPVLLEYTCGLRKLDKLYLDTSFLDDIAFQSKSEGISYLLGQVAKYPPNTVFHFQAWTFGYEDVWIALSKALGSRIHVDGYKMRIFQSLKTRASNDSFSPEFHLASGVAALNGHMCGNRQHPGCLTSEHNVRIHSCEKATMCSAAKHPEVVKIRPIVCRLPNGGTITEAGVGGGGMDFSRQAELDLVTKQDIEELQKSLEIHDGFDCQMKEGITTALNNMAVSGRHLSLKMPIEEFDEEMSAGMISALKLLHQRLRNERAEVAAIPSNARADGLPKVILFPYARHSSYGELCHLVNLFNPKDIWPCTVDNWWIEKGASIQSLFGTYCSEQIFEHDQQMASLFGQQRDERFPEKKTPDPDTQRTLSSGASFSTAPIADRSIETEAPDSVQQQQQTNGSMAEPSLHACVFADLPPTAAPLPAVSQYFTAPAPGTNDSTASASRKRPYEEPAYYAMLSNNEGSESWTSIPLLSTNGNHHSVEVEL